MLLANNSIEHLACYFGVMAYGATMCTIHVEMNRNHLDNILAGSSRSLVLHQAGLELDDLLARSRRRACRLVAGQPARGHVLWRGRSLRAERYSPRQHAAAGHRGHLLHLRHQRPPKGVVLSFREHLSNIIPTADGFDIAAADRIYDYRSFNWASAQLLGALVPLCRGASLIMAKNFSASRFFDDIREHGATVAAGNPTTINMLLNTESAAHRANLPALRFITSSSAPLLVEEWRRFEERFGIPVAQAYGSSETGWIAAIPGEARRLGTAGRPLPYHDLAIVDTGGRRRPAGEIGQVEIGGFADNEYRYLAEDGTIKTNSRGRIRTGDMGLIDAEGFLCLTGREKELIIRGGVNISPLEIDSLLMQQPDVVEVATVGVPDRVWGEEVVSYVVLRPGARIGADDILRYCSTVLPAFAPQADRAQRASAQDRTRQARPQGAG